MILGTLTVIRQGLFVCEKPEVGKGDPMKAKMWLVLGGCMMIAGLLLLGLPPTLQANPWATTDQYGTYASWPSDASWKPINSLNDPNDGLTRTCLDFVGDTINPGAYIFSDANYLYFRVRVQCGTAAFADTIMILVDRLGWGGTDGNPDYAFTWDSQSADNTKHGLEMSITSTVGTSWGAMRMTDLDGTSGGKIVPPDFAAPGGTDGYIRSVDNQSTTNFGTTTFVDFAIKWSYLIANTGLAKGQTWKIQLGSIDNANDHNLIRYDVAGNTSPATVGLVWSSALFSDPTAVTLNDFTATTTARNEGALMALISAIGVVVAGVWISRRM